MGTRVDNEVFINVPMPYNTGTERISCTPPIFMAHYPGTDDGPHFCCRMFYARRRFLLSLFLALQTCSSRRVVMWLRLLSRYIMSLLYAPKRGNICPVTYTYCHVSSFLRFSARPAGLGGPDLQSGCRTRPYCFLQLE